MLEEVVVREVIGLSSCRRVWSQSACHLLEMRMKTSSSRSSQVRTKLDLDSKVFLGQSVAQSFAWTCSAFSIMHVSNFKVLAQIL